MMSTPVVIRVKKRKFVSSGAAATADAASESEAGASAASAVRLLLQHPPDAKRPRTVADTLFVYAGRVVTANAADTEAAVRRAIGKRKLDTEAERLKRRLGERPSEGDGRLVYKRQKRTLPEQVVFAPKEFKAPAEPSESPTASATAAQSPDKAGSRRFRIVDFEVAGCRAGTERIACNGVAMTTNVSPAKRVNQSKDGMDEEFADSDGEGDVYYDLYYGYSDADFGDSGKGDAEANSSHGNAGEQQQQQLQFLLQAYEEAYTYGDDPDCIESAGGGRFAVSDSDSDSNSESNWRNDYPDTPSEDDEDDEDSDDVNDVEDVDPYDDHDDMDGLAGRFSQSVRFAVTKSDQLGEAANAPGGDDDDEAADWTDWQQFKQRLLNAADEQKEQNLTELP